MVKRILNKTIIVSKNNLISALGIMENEWFIKMYMENDSKFYIKSTTYENNKVCYLITGEDLVEKLCLSPWSVDSIVFRNKRKSLWRRVREHFTETIYIYENELVEVKLKLYMFKE